MIKKYLSRLLVGVTALVAVTAAQAGAIDDAVKRGTLRVGMDPTYMPFQMTNKRGEIIGFEVDILKAMAKSMGGMMGKDLPPDEAAKVAAFQQKIMAAMFEEMDLPGMRQDVAKAYAETFSSAELKAQSDFYSTPAGQAMIDKQPQIQQRMTELMMPRMMKAMPKIQAMSQEFAKEQRAAKAAAATKTTPDAPAAKSSP